MISLFFSQAHSSPKEDPELSSDEKRLILGGKVSKEPVSSIPWRLILSKAPVWALIISHFCHNWGTFILLTWMPTYYNQVFVILCSVYVRFFPRREGGNKYIDYYLILHLPKEYLILHLKTQ